MTDYQQLAVACRFGSASKADIESFIQSIVEGGGEYDNRLFEAHADDLRLARAKTLEFIDLSFPGFQLTTTEGLQLCRRELRKQIGLLLDRQITPPMFCGFFNSMESMLVVDSDLPPYEVAFLGDLYNACDWCEDDWTLENSHYLAEEAARIASESDKAEQADAGKRA